MAVEWYARSQTGKEGTRTGLCRGHERKREFETGERTTGRVYLFHPSQAGSSATASGAKKTRNASMDGKNKCPRPE